MPRRLASTSAMPVSYGQPGRDHSAAALRQSPARSGAIRAEARPVLRRSRSGHVAARTRAAQRRSASPRASASSTLRRRRLGRRSSGRHASQASLRSAAARSTMREGLLRRERRRSRRRRAASRVRDRLVVRERAQAPRAPRAVATGTRADRRRTARRRQPPRSSDPGRAGTAQEREDVDAPEIEVVLAAVLERSGQELVRELVVVAELTPKPPRLFSARAACSRGPRSRHSAAASSSSSPAERRSRVAARRVPDRSRAPCRASLSVRDLRRRRLALSCEPRLTRRVAVADQECGT